MVRLAAAMLLCGSLPAQAPPPKPRLEYSGRPLKVPLECRGEDIQTAGLSCSAEDPCPVFLELNSVEAVGNRVIAAGNLHTQMSTLSSILLMSDDGGRTWTEPFPRIPLAALDQMQFLDFETGWISGQIVQVTPRDPFFLLTGDGGKTWRRKPLWEESRTGSIEQFWFESRSNGVLFADRVQTPESGGRYERYESQTGGESWTVRQMSTKPLPLTRQRIADPALRIRADAASKSYRLEHREGAGRWQTVAAFLIDAGECKPEPPKDAENPPPEEPAAKTPAKPAERDLPPVPRPRSAPTLEKKQ